MGRAEAQLYSRIVLLSPASSKNRGKGSHGACANEERDLVSRENYQDCYGQIGPCRFGLSGQGDRDNHRRCIPR